MSLRKGRLAGMRRKIGPLMEGEEEIDEVVALSWPEGRSYTGEEMVEIICHGIPRVARRIIDALVRSGARAAEPGEFTRRAFDGGRIGAVDVMVLASRWASGSRDDAVPRVQNAFVDDFLRKMEQAGEALEGEIEFGQSHPDDQAPDSERTLKDLREDARTFRSRMVSLDRPGRLLIMGPVNSGKSTLFNALSGGVSALVSDEPGTTREGRETVVDIEGRRVRLVDTAGAGGTGIDGRAYRAVVDGLQPSDRVLWLSAGSREPPPSELVIRAAEVLRVCSKCDVAEESFGTEGKGIRLSSVTGEGMELLRRSIAGFPAGLSLTGAADRVLESIEEAVEMLMSGDHCLAAEKLGDAENEVRSMTGRGENILLSVERALSTMCVGK